MGGAGRTWALARSLLGTTLGAVVVVPLQLRYSKVYGETDLDVLYEKWTPTARLTIFSNVFWQRRPASAFGWGFGTQYVGSEIEQLWLEPDGSAGTPITRLRGSPEVLDHLDYDVTSVGYQLRRPARVGVVGAGGGRDVLVTLGAGAGHVDAVELNPFDTRRTGASPGRGRERGPRSFASRGSAGVPL